MNIQGNDICLKWILVEMAFYFLIHIGSYALFYKEKKFSGTRVLFSTRVQANRVSKQKVMPLKKKKKKKKKHVSGTRVYKT